jgi:hypothetical protein
MSIAAPLTVAVVSIILTGLLGNWLSYRWQELRRRRDADLEAADTFHSLYGELFAIWKLWNVLNKTEYASTCPSPNGDTQWRLLERAANAEGRMEALLVRVASEHAELSEESLRNLAAWRQAFQTLRERIRDGQDIGWRAKPDVPGYQEYTAYKVLACGVASLLTKPRGFIEKPPTSEIATKAFLKITGPEFRHAWAQAVDTSK